MPIEYRIYDTDTLLGVMADMPPVSNYWLSLAFGEEITFDDEYIDFEKMVGFRKLAPFVTPMTQGKPIYQEGSEVLRFKPAYVKPKDPVNPSRMIRRTPGNLLRREMSPAERWAATVAAVTRDHREAIERRWEWLAAQAIIYAAVTIEGEDYPTRQVSFRRNPDHTVIFVPGPGLTDWTDPQHDIIGDINDWRHRISRAKFGGPVNRLTLGKNAGNAFLRNEGVQRQLDTMIRGTVANLNIGVREGTDIEYVGQISPSLSVYIYQDYYERPGVGGALEVVDFLHPDEAILTGPNIRGIRAFGAIQDVRAQLRAMPIFPKMWQDEDPSATFLMAQSAPLMVPVNPNNTFRARVIFPAP